MLLILLPYIETNNYWFVISDTLFVVQTLLCLFRRCLCLFVSFVRHSIILSCVGNYC